MSQITLNPDGSITISQEQASPAVEASSEPQARQSNFNQRQGGRNRSRNGNRRRAMKGDAIANACMEVLQEAGYDFGSFDEGWIGNAADTQEGTNPISMAVTDILTTPGGRSYPGNRYLLNVSEDQETTSDDAKGPTCNVLKVIFGPSVASKDAEDHRHTNDVRKAMLEREVQVGDVVQVQTYRRVKAKSFAADGKGWNLDLYVFSHYVEEAEASPEASEE